MRTNMSSRFCCRNEAYASFLQQNFEDMLSTLKRDDLCLRSLEITKSNPEMLILQMRNVHVNTMKTDSCYGNVYNRHLFMIH